MTPSQGTPMPPTNRGRNALESLMALRPRHLQAVSVFASSYLTLDEIRDACVGRYTNLFGRLRPFGSPAVPSDDLRRWLVVEQFIRLVQKRRWEL